MVAATKEPETLVISVGRDTLEAEVDKDLDFWPSDPTVPGQCSSLLGAEHVTVEQAIARVRACAGLELPAGVPAGALHDIVLEAQVLVATMSEGGLVRPVAANLHEALQRLGVTL